MSDYREIIGMPIDKAVSILAARGINAQIVQNTADDRHRYDAELVVRVTKATDAVVLTTARFALKTE